MLEKLIAEIARLADAMQASAEASNRAAEIIARSHALADENTGERAPKPAKPAPAPAPAAKVAKEKAPKPADDAELTVDTLRARLSDVGRKVGADRVKAVVKKFGADKVSGIDPSKYPDVLKAVEALL